MATTPQTNTTLLAIANALKDADDIVIGGHVGPDGDCLGSQLALMHALRSMGKTVTATLAKDEPIDAALAYLPGSDQMVFAGSYDGPVRAFVAVDVPNEERLMPDQWRLHQKAQLTITIDHHAYDKAMADLSYTDPDAASASILVWQVCEYLGASSNSEVAQCAFTGLMTDTGSFRYSNANAEAFEYAAAMVKAGADPSLAAQKVFQNRRRASVELQKLVIERMAFSCGGRFAVSYLLRDDFERLGAVKSDAEPMIDVLRSIEGVDVACMLREQEKDIRGSFRAKDDTDVAALARKYGGGGHKAAAGFSLSLPMGKALDVVCADVMKALA